MALSSKQQAFVEHYLTCWNAAEAARRAGYSAQTARSIGAENLTKPDIQAAIQERLTELEMGADEVLVGLTEHARGSAADFLTIERVKRRRLVPAPAPTDDDPDAVRYEEGPDEYEVLEERIDLEKAQRRGKLHLIRKLSQTKYGISVELYDAQAAKALIGKHHGLFNDTTLNVNVSDLTDDQLARLATGEPIASVLRTAKKDTPPAAR